MTRIHTHSHTYTIYSCVSVSARVGIRSANKRDSCAKSFVTHHRILFSILSRAAALQLRLRQYLDQGGGDMGGVGVTYCPTTWNHI